jgi:xylulokinase
MSSTESKKYFLGIDVGTSGCKGAIFDQDGRSVADEYIPMPLSPAREGWVEQNPDVWWNNVCGISQNLIRKSGVTAEGISSVGISGTNGLVTLGNRGEPLRNAILFTDKRSADEVNRIKDILNEDEIFAITGNRVAPGSYSAPILMWIKKHEPEIYSNIFKIVVPAGFVVFRLTDSISMDLSRSSMTLLFDIKKLKWSASLCDKLGLDWEFLPPLYRSREIVGEITRSAHEATGLAEGTPVIAGCNDTVSAGIGAGAILPGQSYMVIGTSGRICLNIQRPLFDKRFVNIVHGIENQWLNIAAINCAGGSLSWYKRAFAKSIPFDSIIQCALESIPGARRLIYLPYLDGERSPIWDPYARGVLFGLSSSHTKNDVVRAILEGTAYAFRQNLEILEDELKLQVPEMRIAGGGARNLLWSQIIADVLQKPVSLLRNSETETLGCCILAAVGIGCYNTFKEIVDKAVVIVQTIEPSGEHSKTYDELFAVYKDLYTNLKNDFARLSYRNLGGD